MEAFKNGWELFKKKPAPFIISMLIWGAGLVLVGVLMSSLLAGAGSLGARSRSGGVAAGIVGLGFLGTFLMVLVVMTLGMLAQASLVRGALKMHDTGDVELGDFFKFDNVGNILLYGLVVGAGSGLVALTGVGSLIVGALTMYGMFLVVDQKMGFWDAIQGSIKYFTNNLAQSALLYLLFMVATGVGALLCGLGTLVALPVGLLAIATFYRRLGSVPADYSVK